MTASEKQAMQRIADRIKELASLENACFDFKKEKDEYIKSKIKPQMGWFDLTALYIEDIINAEYKYQKQRAIEQTWNL